MRLITIPAMNDMQELERKEQAAKAWLPIVRTTVIRGLNAFHYDSVSRFRKEMRMKSGDTVIAPVIVVRDNLVSYDLTDTPFGMLPETAEKLIKASEAKGIVRSKDDFDFTPKMGFAICSTEAKTEFLATVLRAAIDKTVLRYMIDSVGAHGFVTIGGQPSTPDPLNWEQMLEHYET